MDGKDLVTFRVSKFEALYYGVRFEGMMEWPRIQASGVLKAPIPLVPVSVNTSSRATPIHSWAFVAA